MRCSFETKIGESLLRIELGTKARMVTETSLVIGMRGGLITRPYSIFRKVREEKYQNAQAIRSHTETLPTSDAQAAPSKRKPVGCAA